MSSDRQHTHDIQSNTKTPKPISAPEVSTPEAVEIANPFEFAEGERGVGADQLRLQSMQRLSGVLGNRMLQRAIEGGETTAEPEGPGPEGENAMPADLAEFLARGVMPKDGKDIAGAGMGGFNAKFDPGSRALIVTVKVGFNAVNGLNVDTGTGFVTPNTVGFDVSDPDERDTIQELQDAADRLNNDLTKDERIAEVQSRWQWSGAETGPWMEQYRQSVEGAWGGKHFFVSQDWAELRSSVRMAVDIHLGQQKGDHTNAKIVKTPPGGVGAYVQPGKRKDPNDQELIMSSSDVGPREDNLLDWQIFFQNNSADVNTATSETGEDGPTFLKKFIKSFSAANPNGGVPIQLIGRASSTGAAAYNQTLSEKRAANVEKFLKDNGLVGSVDRTVDSGTGETGSTDDASFRRVDIIVGDGQAQNVANHEFGHMIGLDDEYVSHEDGSSLISGSGNDVGTPVTHNDVNKNKLGDVQIDGAVAENNDNIMSLGNSVKPQHYSTFHNALEIVTGKKWKYGGEGDAPSVIPGQVVPGGVIT